MTETIDWSSAVVTIDHDDRVAMVNGDRWEFFNQTGGSRTQYKSPDGLLLLKVDSKYHPQGAVEKFLWEELDYEDRPYFVEILGWVEAEGPYATLGAVFQPFIEGMQSGYGADPEIEGKADDLAEKYALDSDWGQHQYKLVGDSFIIHDYGISKSDNLDPSYRYGSDAYNGH